MTERDKWIKSGKKQKAMYLVVVADTFDYENYPVYCNSEAEKNEALKKFNNYQQMSRVMEVVKL